MLEGEIQVFCLAFILCRSHVFANIEKFGSDFNPPSCDHFRLLDLQNSHQIGSLLRSRYLGRRAKLTP